MDTKIYKMLRLDIRDKSLTNEFVINRNQISRYKIAIRESEIIRILTKINSDNSVLDGDFPFVKDLLVLK